MDGPQRLLQSAPFSLLKLLQPQHPQLFFAGLRFLAFSLLPKASLLGVPRTLLALSKRLSVLLRFHAKLLLPCLLLHPLALQSRPVKLHRCGLAGPLLGRQPILLRLLPLLPPTAHSLGYRWPVRLSGEPPTAVCQQALAQWALEPRLLPSVSRLRLRTGLVEPWAPTLPREPAANRGLDEPGGFLAPGVPSQAGLTRRLDWAVPSLARRVPAPCRLDAHGRRTLALQVRPVALHLQLGQPLHQPRGCSACCLRLSTVQLSTLLLVLLHLLLLSLLLLLRVFRPWR
jgi:hypothetical protein